MSTDVEISGGQFKILQVETDRDTSTNLAAALDSGEGQFELTVESDPTDALARLDTTDFDCLVSRYDLPEMNGVELVRAIRMQDDSFPVILFTGEGDETVASQAISAGVTDYIRKKSNQGGIDALVRRIQKLADDGESLSEVGSRYESAQLSQFLRAFPDTVFVMSEDGRYLDVISGGDQSLLYDDPDDLLGYRFHDVLPEETADRFLETVQRALETGEQQQIEYELAVKKGKRWFEARVGPLQTNSESRTVFWIARDITERKQHEQEYEQIFDSVTDAITVFDPQSETIVDVNETFRDLLGYDDIEQIQRIGIEGVSASNDGYTGERGWEIINTVHESGEPTTVDWRGETSEGDRLWLEATLAPAEVGGQERVLSIQRDITERRKLEQTYKDIFENVSDGLIVHDPTTADILEANERFCELTGYDREELLEQTIRQIMPDDPEYTFQDVLDRIQKAREEGPQLFEFKARRKDGDVFMCETHLRTIEIRGNERVLASVRDITERKRRKQEYEQIFHGVNDTITIHDTETAELLDVNDTFCDLLGYDRDEILEMGITGYSPAEQGYTMEQAREFVQAVIDGDEPKRTDWAVETRDGETRWLDVKGTTVEVGGAVQYVSISRDVTERKRREREYKAIFNNVNDIIAVRDPETGEIVDANQSYADLLGYSREEIQGMKIGDVGVPDDGYDDERGMEYLRTVMESDEPVEFEWKVEDTNGRAHLMDVRGTDAVINGEPRYLAIGRDVTERKRRQRAIETLQEATERLQTAETPAEVATIAVETASDILELPMAICWFDGEETDQLEPSAATDPVHDAGLVSALATDRYEYDVFVEGAVTVYSPTEQAPDNPLETGVLLPLADHGLIAAGTREDIRADETVLDVAKALADHVTTALDRVERAQAVRESERRFRLIAERIDEVIYLAKPDFSEVLYVNPAYEEIWGRPIDELDGNAREFIEAADDRDSADLEAEFETMVEEIQAGEADDSYDFEYRIRQPDGELRWVHGTGYAVALPSGNRRFVGIVDDITERKHREQRLEVFNRILRHNLRNQLDVIRSHAEVLADRTETNHAKRIIAAVDELAAIGAEARETDRIMSMGEQTTEIRISETVQETIGAVGGNEMDIELRTDIPTTKPLVTNETAVEIAVESALENAVEHANSAVTVAVEEHLEKTTVTIDDDGPGIPEEQLVPIETGTETNLRHGRGLGLWQLRWSVDKLNGELSFDTTDGTTIRIAIPDQSESYRGN